MNKVSIVIPVYNEEKIVEKTIFDVSSKLKELKIYKSSEIIIVNDGSNDNTYNILSKNKDIVLLNNLNNMGYGYSLKKGISEAKNETIVIMDADGTYPIEELDKLLKEKSKGYDLVVGSRTGKYYRGSFAKSILRRILKSFVEYVSDKKIVDVNSGYRVFDKSTITKYFNRLCNTFSFTTSLTLAYMMNNLTVKYIDIPYNKRVGKSKIRIIKDSIISMKYILESGIYYNPLKIFSLFSKICIVLSIIGFIFSHFLNIKAGYILGIGGLLLSLIVICIGFVSVLLKQIMDK